MQTHSLQASDRGAKSMSHVQSGGVTQQYAASQRPDTQVWLALFHYPTVLCCNEWQHNSMQLVKDPIRKSG